MSASTPFNDLDSYIGLPRLGGLAISPDGTRLVSVVSTLDEDRTAYSSALWEIDPTGTYPARRLTFGAEGESSPVFTSTGDLLFVAKRPAKGEDSATAKLWCLPAGGGEAHALAELPGGVSGAMTARSAEVTMIKGSVHLEATSLEQDEQIRKHRKENKIDSILHTGYPIRYWDRDLGPAYPRLFVVEDSGPRDLTPAVGTALTETSACLSPDGRFAITSMVAPKAGADQTSVLAKIDLTTGALRVIFDDEEAFSATVSPDGRHIAFLQETIPDPYTAPNVHVWVMDADGRGARNLSGDWDLWANGLTWLPDSSGLLVTADSGGRGPVFRLGLDGEVTQVTQTDTTFTDVVCVDDTRAYALQSSYAVPPEVVAIDLESGDVTRLQNPHERPVLPGTLRDVEAFAGDGQRVRSWLALPEGACAENPAPMLLWIHGGPLGSWNAWSWRWNPWLAVAEGYAVLLPDPALSTGYGQAFIQRGWGQWGGTPYTDLMAATDAAEKLPEIDASRTAAMGGSFGGYMANWVAGHTDRFKAIVTHASLWNLHTFGPTTDASFYWAKEMTSEMVAANSPHAHVADIVTPMLVIHGDKDYRVPIGEGLALWYQLLAESGLPAADDGTSEHRFLYFPSENHWILTPQHAKVWYQTVFEFLERNLAD